MAFARQLLLVAALGSLARASDLTTCTGLDAEDSAACSPDREASDAKVFMLQSSLQLREFASSALHLHGRETTSQAANESSLAEHNSSSVLEYNTSSVSEYNSSSVSEYSGSSDFDSSVSSAAGSSGSSALESTGASASIGVTGSSSCPCIGISGRNGTVIAKLADNNGAMVNVNFEIDLGSRCDRWDYKKNPVCTGAIKPLMDPAWCLQKWCYVDPCNCNLPTVPKVAMYFPGAKVQDKSVYYSYEACGEQDLFTSKVNTNACVNQKTTTDCFKLSQCSWSLTRGCVGKELTGSMCATNHLSNAMIWGMSDCSCIGVNGTVGNAEATIALGNATTKVNFTSNVGATCSAWDDGVHPDCDGPEPRPSWCKKKWCLVDPCKCGLQTPPKLSTYFVGAKWLTHQIYYSYAACGETDDYTASMNAGACTNQADESSCASQGSKCTWTIMNNKYQCLGTDLATLCTSSSGGASSGSGGSGQGGSSRSGAERSSAAALVLAVAAPLLAVSGLRAL